MKKNVMLLLCLFAIGNLYAQQTKVDSKINPNKSRGYIYWDAIPNASSYRISYLSENDGGVLTEFDFATTTDNYARLKIPYFGSGDNSYQLSALDSRNRTIAVGEVQALNTNGISGEVLCKRKCNGPDYAYKIELLDVPNAGNLMSLSSTLKYSYYTGTELIQIPYYQGMERSVWNGLPNNHPYKQITTTGVMHYDTLTITDILIADSGLFYNPTGTTVGAGGILIEKKMNEFSWMEGTNTIGTASASENYCLNGVTMNSSGGWLSFFNTNADWPAVPSGTEYSWTVPTTLVCNTAYNQSGNDPTTNNWNAWLTELHELVLELEDNGPGFGNITYGKVKLTMDPMLFESFVFTPIDQNSNDNFIIKKNDQGESIVISASGEISKGLYRLTALTKTKDIIPYVFEVENDLQIVDDNTTATLLVTPNPIADNGNIVVRITSTSRSNPTLTVHDLNGQELYSNGLNLTSTSNDLIAIPTTGTPPYNQYIVTLTFADGSTIQQTALKL